jgi:hypothetical protein
LQLLILARALRNQRHQRTVTPQVLQERTSISRSAQSAVSMGRTVVLHTC